MSETNFVSTILDSLAQGAADNQLQLAGVNAIVVPEKYNLTSLEKFQAQPDFFRAALTTENVFHFIDYIKTNAVEGSLVFVNTSKGVAQAIIDAGTPDSPKWGHHRARLELNQSPAFNALCKYDGNYRSQRDFLYFLEDWAANIQFIYAAGNETPSDFKTGFEMIKKLKYSRKVEGTNEVGNHSASGSVMDSVGVSSNESDLPIGFVFSCDMYDDYAPTVLTCRLQSRINDTSVNLCYSIMSLEATREAAGQQLYKDLNFEGSLAKTYKGVMKYQGI